MEKKIISAYLAVLLLLTSFMAYWGIVKPKPISSAQNSKDITYKDIRIAFVNEDLGYTYNDDDIHLAENLINRFIEDNDYNIELVSRSIAENGLNKGTYNIMLIFPSRFSQEALELEKFSPKQAIFHYKIRADEQVLIKQSEQVVSNMKVEFNKYLVDIYFTSIIGNLQNAQSKMYEVVEREDKTIKKYDENLTAPLNNYSDKFKGISGTSDNMLSNYSSFYKSINDTGEAFGDISKVDKDYSGQLNAVFDEQRKWQESINEREDGLDRYDNSLSRISVKDELDNIVSMQDFLKSSFDESEISEDTLNKANALNQKIEELKLRFTTVNRETSTVLRDFESRLREGITGSYTITEVLERAISTTSMGMIVQGLQNILFNVIDAQVLSLPMFSDEIIDRMPLSDNDKQHMKNVNTFVEWYCNKYDKPLPNNVYSSNFDLYNFSMEEFVLEDLQRERSFTIPSFEGDISKLKFTVPQPYIFADIYINDEEYSVYENSFELDNIRELRSVKFTLSTQDINNIDILSPFKVSMDIETKEVLRIATPVSATDSNVPESYQVEDRDFLRQYQSSELIFSYADHTGSNETTAVLEDLKPYLKVSSFAKLIFNVDLQSEFSLSYEESDMSLMNKVKLPEIPDVFVNIVAVAIGDRLRDDLIIKEDTFNELDELKTDTLELSRVSMEFIRTRNDLIYKTDDLEKDVREVYDNLENKPVFKVVTSRDNADVVKVSMDINEDLIRLMSASRNLLNNTMANQAVSEDIKSSFENLSENVAGLEKDGKELSGKVKGLKSVMDTEYGDNNEFYKEFNKVLSNTRIGNSRNNAVYTYLSNPVNISNIDTLLDNKEKVEAVHKDTRSSIVTVLIMYILGMLIAYMMQNIDFTHFYKRRAGHRKSVKNAALPITLICIMSLVCSSILSIISINKLDMWFEKGLGFYILIFLNTLLCASLSNYILKKLKTAGMSIIIGTLLLYIISAGQLFDESYTTSNKLLARFSLLTYMDNMIGNYIAGNSNIVISTLVLFTLTSMAIVLNLFEYKEIGEI